MSNLSIRWKSKIAWLVKLPLFNALMRWGIRLFVPKHRIGVVLVIMDEAERVLMLYHVFHPYKPWGLPGGWLDKAEAPAEGVLRELKEETGLTAVIDHILFVERQTLPPHLGIAYLGHITEGAIQLSSEIIDAQWFPSDALPPAMQTFHQMAIETAVSLRRQGAITRS